MGYTNLTNVLRVIRQGIFPPGENNVLVLFVSGPSPDIVSSAREAALARNGPDVIQILVVAVGQMYSRDEVNAIAITSGVAGDQGVNIFPADNFRSSLVTGLVDAICNSKRLPGIFTILLAFKCAMKFSKTRTNNINKVITLT